MLEVEWFPREEAGRPESEGAIDVRRVGWEEEEVEEVAPPL